MLRYSSYEDFKTRNEKNFSLVFVARTKLKSNSDMGIGGQALTEAEGLSFEFLNLSSLVTDLMFGLSASVLDAKAKLKEIEGIFFRENTKSAADKAKLIAAEPNYIAATQNFNDLTDLQEFLLNKKKDFEAAYYHYRGISNKN